MDHENAYHLQRTANSKNTEERRNAALKDLEKTGS